MSLWTAAELAAATGGTASAEFAAMGVAFDSREVGPGDLFVALSGEATDGHRFLQQAFAQGAAGAIVFAPCDGPHVRVPDSFAALEDIARAARARTAARVIWRRRQAPSSAGLTAARLLPTPAAAGAALAN